MPAGALSLLVTSAQRLQTVLLLLFASSYHVTADHAAIITKTPNMIMLIQMLSNPQGVTLRFNKNSFGDAYSQFCKLNNSDLSCISHLQITI